MPTVAVCSSGRLSVPCSRCAHCQLLNVAPLGCCSVCNPCSYARKSLYSITCRSLAREQGLTCTQPGASAALLRSPAPNKKSLYQKTENMTGNQTGASKERDREGDRSRSTCALFSSRSFSSSSFSAIRRSRRWEAARTAHHTHSHYCGRASNTAVTCMGSRKLESSLGFFPNISRAVNIGAEFPLQQSQWEGSSAPVPDAPCNCLSRGYLPHTNGWALPEQRSCSKILKKCCKKIPAHTCLLSPCQRRPLLSRSPSSLPAAGTSASWPPCSSPFYGMRGKRAACRCVRACGRRRPSGAPILKSPA